MKRVSTRAIIFIDDKIALIYRNKFENIYYSLPGGGVEGNETLEEATIREVKEELNLDVEVLDIGVPVLSMHSPFEIVSKIDVYMTYKAFYYFINNKK